MLDGNLLMRLKKIPIIDRARCPDKDFSAIENATMNAVLVGMADNSGVLLNMEGRGLEL